MFLRINFIMLFMYPLGFSGDIAGCGGILTGSSEFLMSEPTQTNCQWTIQLQDTKVIVFKIMEIQFDEISICDEEYLKVNKSLYTV